MIRTLTAVLFVMSLLLGTRYVLGQIPLNHGYLVPPGTPFNSYGEPYSRSLTIMSPQERKNVANSMAWIKAHMGHPEAWCLDWSSTHGDLTGEIPPNNQTKRARRHKAH